MVYRTPTPLPVARRASLEHRIDATLRLVFLRRLARRLRIPYRPIWRALKQPEGLGVPKIRVAISLALTLYLTVWSVRYFGPFYPSTWDHYLICGMAAWVMHTTLSAAFHWLTRDPTVSGDRTQP